MTIDSKDNEIGKPEVRERRERECHRPSKVVVRHLPPTLTEESFLEEISLLPKNDYFQFYKPDFSLGIHARARAYINFDNYEDVWLFCQKWDGHNFLDNKGNKYSAIVELAPFQKIAKKRAKPDLKRNTIEQDPDYLKFVKSVENPDVEPIAAPESYIEAIEEKEKLIKDNFGTVKITTPLLEHIAKRKEERRQAINRARDERKRKEVEKRKQREDERKRHLERQRDRYRERERERDQDKNIQNSKSKDKDKIPKLMDQPIKLLHSRSSDRSFVKGKLSDDDSSESCDESEKRIESENKENYYEKNCGKQHTKEYKRHASVKVKSRTFPESKNKSADKTEPPKSTKVESDEDSMKDEALEDSDHEKIELNSNDKELELNADRLDDEETVEPDSEEVKSSDKTNEGMSDSNQNEDFDDKHSSKPEDIKSSKDCSKSESCGKSTDQSKQRIRYKDRPERAIYVPGKRAAERAKLQNNDIKSDSSEKKGGVDRVRASSEESSQKTEESIESE